MKKSVAWVVAAIYWRPKRAPRPATFEEITASLWDVQMVGAARIAYEEAR